MRYLVGACVAVCARSSYALVVSVRSSYASRFAVSACRGIGVCLSVGVCVKLRRACIGSPCRCACVCVHRVGRYVVSPLVGKRRRMRVRCRAFWCVTLSVSVRSLCVRRAVSCVCRSCAVSVRSLVGALVARRCVVRFRRAVSLVVLDAHGRHGCGISDKANTRSPSNANERKGIECLTYSDGCRMVVGRRVPTR